MGIVSGLAKMNLSLKFPIFIISILCFCSVNNVFSVKITDEFAIDDTAIEPSGERYWLATSNGAYQLDTQTHQILNRIETPGPAQFIDVSPDGQKLLVGGVIPDCTPPNFCQIRSIEGALITSVTGTLRFHMPVFSQDSQKAIIIDQGERVQVYDTQTGEPVFITEPHNFPVYSAAWDKFDRLHVLGYKKENNYLDIQCDSFWKYTWFQGKLFNVTGVLFGDIYNNWYTDFLLSNDGILFSYTTLNSFVKITIPIWSVGYSGDFFYTFMTEKWDKGGGYTSSIRTNFSDDGKYVILSGYDGSPMISVQQLPEGSHWWINLDAIIGYTAAIDECTIQEKPYLITLATKSEKPYNKVVVFIDVENNELLSESPPLDELFGSTRISSWMLY